MIARPAPRRRLVRATGWFTAAVAVLAMAIGLLYLGPYPWPQPLDAQLYTVLAYTSHFGVLAALPWVLIVLPLCLLLPRPALVLTVSVLGAALGLSWLLLDALLFAENQFHINALTLTILGAHTWLFGAVYVLMFAGLGGFLMQRLWRWSAGPAQRRPGPWLVLALALAFVTAQVQHVWADARYYVPITGMTHYLPLYQPATARRLLVRHGLVDLNRNRERQLLEGIGGAGGGLTYPLAPLQCASAERLNLLMVVIDAMRADMLTPVVAPRLWQFSESAQRYRHHYSGGNSSRMGVYSLFYGLPSTYWQNIEASQVPALLVTELQNRGYQLGIFGSAPIYSPVSLDRTVFARVPDLRIETTSTDGGPSERDRAITDEWLEWLAARDGARPFFGFLYYDAPTSRDFPEDYAVPFGSDAQGRYRTSIHYADSLLGEVLDDLRRRDLLETTIVLVTSDHGEGFDAAGLGFKGHGSAYDRAQLQVPFVVHWPGQAPGERAYRTSHNDWSATVIGELFGCANPPADYTSGKSLFERESWDWLVVGSYHNYAIVQPDQVIVSQVGGSMEVRDADYRIIADPVLDPSVISEALRETNRFYGNR